MAKDWDWGETLYLGSAPWGGEALHDGADKALISPREHLSLTGIYDPLTPPDGLDRIDAKLREAYAAVGAPEAWRLSRHATGHLEMAAMRAEAVGFLQRWL